jgi:chaperonin GroEL
VEEGIVAGGGVALIRTLPDLEKLEKETEGDRKLGVQIVKKAIQEPLRWIAENAGYNGYLVVEEVKKRKQNEGFNALTGEYVDLLEAGIIDPTKVERIAIQNAASIAGLLLTTEAIVVEIKEKKENAPAPGGNFDEF